MKGSFETTGGKVAFYFFIALFVLMTLFPLLWIVKMSVITQSELSQSPPTISPARTSKPSRPNSLDADELRY